ncbi:polymorphic toxin-type HINT domain-containing protein [Actinosynnema sp. NPDC050436]|uniref:polymorphic toxin-type HINT domain-containing protein n=1 Tax=Actinosynnema sp. NPDC050436 TaxID=3155659 RepID=UPI0033C7CF18
MCVSCGDGISAGAKAWVDAFDLEDGDELRAASGQRTVVTGKRVHGEYNQVYNCSVADLRTYYVLAGETPVLVHNTGCPTGTGRELLDGRAQLHIIHGDHKGGGHK